jgi:hypothetical protein
MSASCLSLWKGSPKIWNISSVVMFQLHAYVLTRMDRLLRINLEDVLELTFPCPQDTDQDDISANCIICYNYRLPHGTYMTYLYHCLMDYDSFWGHLENYLWLPYNSVAIFYLSFALSASENFGQTYWSKVILLSPSFMELYVGTGDWVSKEGLVPDRVCDNGSCGRPFHSACLVEWLRAIPTTRQ